MENGDRDVANILVMFAFAAAGQQAHETGTSGHSPSAGRENVLATRKTATQLGARGSRGYRDRTRGHWHPTRTESLDSRSIIILRHDDLS